MLPYNTVICGQCRVQRVCSPTPKRDIKFTRDVYTNVGSYNAAMRPSASLALLKLEGIHYSSIWPDEFTTRLGSLFDPPRTVLICERRLRATRSCSRLGHC